jgi:hypothetical protein
MNTDKDHGLKKHLGLWRGRTNRTNRTDNSDGSDRKKGLGKMGRLERFNGWKKGVEKEGAVR